MNIRALIAAAFALSLVGGCANLTKVARDINAADKKAAAKADKKDQAACEKMCAVAGDAEDNKAAVENCQKKCRD